MPSLKPILTALLISVFVLLFRWLGNLAKRNLQIFNTKKFACLGAFKCSIPMYYLPLERVEHDNDSLSACLSMLNYWMLPQVYSTFTIQSLHEFAGFIVSPLDGFDAQIVSISKVFSPWSTCWVAPHVWAFLPPWTCRKSRNLPWPLRCIHAKIAKNWFHADDSSHLENSDVRV